MPQGFTLRHFSEIIGVFLRGLHRCRSSRPVPSVHLGLQCGCLLFGDVGCVRFVRSPRIASGTCLAPSCLSGLSCWRSRIDALAIICILSRSRRGTLGWFVSPSQNRSSYRNSRLGAYLAYEQLGRCRRRRSVFSRIPFLLSVGLLTCWESLPFHEECHHLPWRRRWSPAVWSWRGCPLSVIPPRLVISACHCAARIARMSLGVVVCCVWLR